MLKRIALKIGIVVSLLYMITSCQADQVDESPSSDANLVLGMTRAGGVVIDNLQLFAFKNSDKKFNRKLTNVTREGDVVKTAIEVGTWNLAMVSTYDGASVIAPSAGVTMANSPMYIYNPTLDPLTGKSTNASEIVFANITTPTIVADQISNMSASMARNVAMVELIVTQATPNFNKNPTAANLHKIRLHNVPSTISYSGELMRSGSVNKINPDTVSGGLVANLKLKDSSNPAYLCSDTVRFIIPAHMGTDFSAANPTDVVGVKMSVDLDMERTGGTRFKKTKQINVVALCNKVLRVNITVNDGLEFGTEILPWDRVTINETVGDQFTGWLYVKQGGGGSGQSWSDPLGDISSAVNKAVQLQAASFLVNGILVAGGSTLYNSGGYTPIQSGLKVFGGWVGTPGTELARADTQGPYTAPNTVRDLTKKSIVNMGGSFTYFSVMANSLFDGFTLTGGTSTVVLELVSTNSTANAVEFINNNASGSCLAMNSGSTATNILIRNCTNPIVISGGKLVNATIVNNTMGTGTPFTGATIQNSIFWGNSKPITFSGSTVQNCMFPSPVPTTGITTGNGTNLPLNTNNTSWFTATNFVPGPFFKSPTTGDFTALNSNAPMLGRGNELYFNNATTTIPAANKKDINGNPRIRTINSERWTDIGCYENTTFPGFRLRWSSDRVYISSKGGYVSDVPLMLPDNETNPITVNWTLAIQGTLNYSTFNGPSSGTGTGIVVGSFKITPNLPDYLANAERLCGTVRVSTNLGEYLPDADIQIYQTPGASSVWSDGYVGSFHRNSETSERYISGPNTGAWSARVIAGLDWIKIDGNAKGFNGGVVEDTFGGVITGTGAIRYRIGMKSTLAAGAAPRYGLVVITRTGGVAMFFVRQGENADYLYRPEDTRTGGRAAAKQFSPYSLRDPQDRTVDGGVELGARGGGFVTHPSKIGNFFQRNRTKAYLRGVQTLSLPYPGETVVSDTREVCPPGYRHGTMEEWVHSCYFDVAYSSPTTSVSPQGAEALRNFVWGRLADGYYDQMAPDPLTSAVDEVGVAPNVAMKGILMVNHYNYGSLFFPTAGTMTYSSPASNGNVNYSMVPTSSSTSTANTHWNTGHVGMNCTTIAATTAAEVRCVKE